MSKQFLFTGVFEAKIDDSDKVLLDWNGKRYLARLFGNLDDIPDKSRGSCIFGDTLENFEGIDSFNSGHSFDFSKLDSNNIHTNYEFETDDNSVLRDLLAYVLPSSKYFFASSQNTELIIADHDTDKPHFSIQLPSIPVAMTAGNSR
jgi:hypothetical protein